MNTYQIWASDQISESDNDMQLRVNARVQELTQAWEEAQGFIAPARVVSRLETQAWCEVQS
jgi:hypothetical protein